MNKFNDDCDEPPVRDGSANKSEQFGMFMLLQTLFANYCWNKMFCKLHNAHLNVTFTTQWKILSYSVELICLYKCTVESFINSYLYFFLYNYMRVKIVSTVQQKEWLWSWTWCRKWIEVNWRTSLSGCMRKILSSNATRRNKMIKSKSQHNSCLHEAFLCLHREVYNVAFIQFSSFSHISLA